MKTHNLGSWEAFEKVVKQLNIETEKLKENEKTIGSTTPIIYRGQAESNWHLESILRRKVKKDITIDWYFNLMLEVWDNPASTYGTKWPDLESQIKGLKVDEIYSFLTAKAESDQIISFMVHLRQHGFPSPLLDWTANPLIAAFFAFEKTVNSDGQVAIYTFREHTGYMPDMSDMLEPTAIVIGHNIPGIERHKNQKSHYTLCVVQDNISDFRNAKFASVEEDINKSGFYVDRNGNDIDLDLVQNVTCKYTIPVSERNKVLKMLQKKNIDRCFLFGETEDNRLSDCWNSILADKQI